MKARPPRIAIVGGGITGLAAGFYLERNWGIDDFVILEAEPTLGGNVVTLRTDGFVVENGPNGFLASVPETLELARDLGLEPLRSSDAARKRFIAGDDALFRVPEGPLSFLRSPLLSPRGRLRVFGEPFAPAKPPGDETVFAFAARRIGREAAETLVDTMVTGVFAGDSTNLSLASAFPKMAAMEAAHGGLVRALLAGMVKRLRGGGRSAAAGGPSGPGGVLTSFRNGFAELIEALDRALAGKIRRGVEVTELRRSGGGFVLATTGGEVAAEQVLLAVPAPRAAAILDRSLPAAADLMRRIPAAPVAVVALAFAKSGFPHPLGGFGFLVPRRARSRLLGCLWDSSVFENRAPPDKVLLRAMVGGARDPRALALSDEALVDLALGQLRRFMGRLPGPERTWLFRYPFGISQYPPGHGARLGALDVALATMPGLHAAGNSYRGISVNFCVVQAKEVSYRVARAARATR